MQPGQQGVSRGQAVDKHSFTCLVGSGDGLHQLCLWSKLAGRCTVPEGLWARAWPCSHGQATAFFQALLYLFVKCRVDETLQ